MLFGARRLIEGQRIPGVHYFRTGLEGKKKKPSGSGSMIDALPGYDGPTEVPIYDSSGNPATSGDPGTAPSDYTPAQLGRAGGSGVSGVRPPSASSKLKAYRKEAAKIVDKAVEFDKDSGLPKVKSAAKSVVKASKLSAPDVAKEVKQTKKAVEKSGIGPNHWDRVERKQRNQSDRRALESTLESLYGRGDYSGVSRKKGEQLVTQASKADWKQAKKDGLGVTEGVRSPWNGTAKDQELEHKRLYANLREDDGKNLFPTALQAKTDSDITNIVGEFIPDTPAEIALSVAGGVGIAKKAYEGVKAVKAVRKADEAKSAVAAATEVAKATKTGKRLKRAREISKSKPVQAAKLGAAAGTVGALQATGNLEPIAKGVVSADPGAAAATTARGLLGIPIATAAAVGNVGLTGVRALEAIGNSDSDKTDPSYILGPAKRFVSENIRGAQDMAEVFLSKDAERIAKATEEDYGYLPEMGAAALLRPLTGPAARSIGGAARDATRGAVDDARLKKSSGLRRPADVAPPAVFPKLARRGENKQNKRRVARESSRRTQTETIGLKDMSFESRRMNTGPGRKINKKLDRERQRLEAENPNQKIPISQQDLAVYVGSEARFSTRSKSEALAQIALREKELDDLKVRADAPERYQLAALKLVPELLARPKRRYTAEQMAKFGPKKRAEIKAAQRFWDFVDARNRGAELTPGVLRELSPREVADAMAVNTIDPEAKLKAPEFELDARQTKAQATIDEARKSNKRAARSTITQERKIAEQRGRVEQMEIAERKRMRIPGRKPSKRLARAQQKLADMTAALETHKADLRANIDNTRQAQNALTSRLTKMERQQILAALPKDATASQKRAALATAREEKLKVDRAEQIAPIRKQFDKTMDQAMEKYGIERSSFIMHRDEQGREKIASAGSIDRMGGAKDKRRTGSMRKKGEVVYDFKAAVDTIRNAAKRESEARLSNALVEDAAFVHDFGNGEQKLFTRDEETLLRKEGRIRPNEYKFVRAGMLDSEEGRRKILDSENPAAALSDAIKEDNRTDVLAQKFDAEGKGDRGYLMKASQIDYTLEAMRSLEGGWKFLSEVNGLGSRAVLNTSFAWMMAQPVAEMLVLLMDHPSPTRLIKSMKIVKQAHDDPTLARALATGSDSALSRETISSNSKAYQGSTHDATTAMKETPISALAKSMGTLDMPAYIDRAKGGWIRKVGYAAEVDRELNSKVRQFAKAFSGQLDEIDKVSDKLRTMNRRDQIVWLDTAPGRRAAERLQNNQDDMLGNWTALGPREREFAQLVFFYPFMRYSVDWTLRTFPKRHPIRYALATSMSQWNAEQLEEWLTSKPSFFSQWATAPIYGSETGAPTSFVPFSRATPSGNALTELFGEADSLADLSKSFSPALGLPMRVIFNYDSFGQSREDPYASEKENPIIGGIQNFGEQALGMTFPTRLGKRLIGGRDPQPGDESATTYAIRGGVFPFLPQDYKKSKIRADVSKAYEDRNAGFEQSKAGGDRYSELNDKFKDMGRLGAPEIGSPLRKEYIEWNELRKERKKGTKKIDAQEAKLRAIYKQEGTPIPDDSGLKLDAKVGELVGGTLSKKEMAELDKKLPLLSPDRIEVAVRTAPAKRIKATPKAKRIIADKILDAKEKLTSAGGIKGLSSPGYDKFVNTLSKEIGGALSPKVLAAWTTQEGGNTSKGDWNLLNIGQADSGPYGPALEADKWSSPATAAKWTAKFLRDEYGGPSESIAAILSNAQGKNDLDQIAVIAGTDWAGDPNYQANITRNYEGLDVVSVPAKDSAAAKQNFARLVKRGKAMGVYETPKRSARIKPIPAAGPGKGDWGGMEFILQKAAKGIDISSTKRAVDDPLTVSNPDSDHSEGNTNAYAVDLPATGEAGMEIAKKMHKKLGLAEPLATGTYNWYTSNKYPGTRFQVLWEVEGHYDHVHVGGENPEGQKIKVGPTSVMDQAKAARAPESVATGSTSQTSGSTTTTSFPSTNGTPSNTSDQQAPYNQPMNKWQKLMAFRDDPTGTAGITDTASDPTLPDLSAAEQIATLPALKRKKTVA